MENQQQSENEPVTPGEKKIEQLSRQPIIESFVTRSQDGNPPYNLARLLLL